MLFWANGSVCTRIKGATRQRGLKLRLRDLGKIWFFPEVREFLKQQGVTWDLCFLSARAFNCVCLRVGPRAGFLKSPGTAHRSLTAARAGGVPVRRGSDGADTFVKGTARPARLSYERVYSRRTSSTALYVRARARQTMAGAWVGGWAGAGSKHGGKEGRN